MDVKDIKQTLKILNVDYHNQVRLLDDGNWCFYYTLPKDIETDGSMWFEQTLALIKDVFGKANVTQIGQNQALGENGRIYCQYQVFLTKHLATLLLERQRV